MPAGSLTLELLSTGGGTCNSNPYAVCLSNFKINIASSCNVTIEPLMADNSYVPGIWSSNSGGTYTRLVSCPTWSREPVAPAGSGSPDQSQMKAAIKQAIEQQIYGSDYPQTLSGVTWQIFGQVYLATTIPESCSLKYAITQVRGWWADESACICAAPTNAVLALPLTVTACGGCTLLSPSLQATDGYDTLIDSAATRAACGVLHGLLGDGSECASLLTGCDPGRRPVDLGYLVGYACVLCSTGRPLPSCAGQLGRCLSACLAT